MAYSDQDILGKIGDLLVDINEQYAALDKEQLHQHKTALLLLSAQATYLAAHLEVLVKIQDEAQVNTTGNSLNQAGFTPAAAFSASEADSQPVVEEIQEVIPTIPVATEQKPLIEEYKEEIPFTSTYGATSQVQDREVRAEERQEIQQEEAKPVFTPESIEIEQATTSITDSLPPLDPTPVHTPESAYTQVRPSYESPVERPVEVAPQPVINQVRIEEKEVKIEEPVQPEATLNDLAKQAEEKPNRPLTLNELIQQQKKAGVTTAQQFNTSADRAGTERVGDLKIAVSLNDKLLFIKDLFNGYSMGYGEAIELLNRFDNFGEADAFLQTNYALKNNWAAKPQTVEKLYAILRKKYI